MLSLVLSQTWNIQFVLQCTFLLLVFAHVIIILLIDLLACEMLLLGLVRSILFMATNLAIGIAAGISLSWEIKLIISTFVLVSTFAVGKTLFDIIFL